MEAHKVNAELESIKASGKALLPTFFFDSKGNGKKGDGKGGKNRQGKDTKGQPAGKGGDGQKPVCHNMRDYGTCKFGDSCRFSHDQADIKRAKTEMMPLEPERKGGKKDKKGKGKGKDKGKAESAKPPGVSRVQFPDRLCNDIKAGKECRRGKECKFSHDKSRFDADGKLKMKAVAPVNQGDAAGSVDWSPPSWGGGQLAQPPATGRTGGAGAANPFAYPVWTECPGGIRDPSLVASGPDKGVVLMAFNQKGGRGGFVGKQD